MSGHKTFTLDEIEQQTGFDKRTIAYYVQQGLLPKVGRRGPKTRYPQLFLDRLQFVNMIREKQDLGEIGSLTLSDIRDILDRVSPETIAGVVAGEEPLEVVDHSGDLQPMASKPPHHDSAQVVSRGSVGSAALAEEFAEISESFFRSQEDQAPVAPNPNRQVRMGLLDANSAASPEQRTSTMGSGIAGAVGGGGSVQPARRYEDEVKNNEEALADDASATETEASDAEDTPPSIEIERLGWFLARLQRAMTGDRRRRTGTTESWHRALITPELTISARNLKDADAHMLDGVARILKKLLWEAWEE